MGCMATYTDADKAIAIEIIDQHDGNVSQALADIRAVLKTPKLSRSSVYDWWKNKDRYMAVQNTGHIKKEDKPASAPDKDMVKTTLARRWLQITEQYLDRASDEDAVKDVKALDAVKGAAIATDKLLKLMDIPDEIIVIIPGLIEAIAATGRNPATVLSHFKNKLMDEQNSLYEH